MAKVHIVIALCVTATVLVAILVIKPVGWDARWIAEWTGDKADQKSCQCQTHKGEIKVAVSAPKFLEDHSNQCRASPYAVELR